jgi:DNA-binding CsgD family transcriptional regulator
MSEPALDFAAIVDGLRLAVFVFEGFRSIYANDAGRRLQERLRREYQADLNIMLRDHLSRMQESAAARTLTPAVTLLTNPHGEPLYVHVLPLPGRDGKERLAVTVRELGIEREAFARRYGLSPREVEVAELVLRGYANPTIAYRLGIAPTTAKRHLTRIFDKIGVDSRTQLLSRLA